VPNFACRIVSGAKKYDRKWLPIKWLPIKWLPIRKQLYLGKANLVLKCMNGMAPGYLADRFVKRCSISGRQTRSSQLLDIPPLKIIAGQRYFYYQAVKLWNDRSDRLEFLKMLTFSSL